MNDPSCGGDRGATPPETSPESRRRSLPRRILNRFEVDRAVFYAIVARMWQFLAGPITLLLVTFYFSPEVQGFYFTFWSILGLQVFFELAFPQAIITTASHQWSRLSLDSRTRIIGDPDARSRLVDLMRVSVLAYLVLALLVGLVIGSFGLRFFAQDPASENLDWVAPWIVLIVTGSITFAAIPFLAVLEGCNQVKQVYQLNAVRAIVGNAVVWIAIPMGGELWVPALAMLARLVCELGMIFGIYRGFFATFLKPPEGARLPWRLEVWPYQWRLIVKGFFGYLNADIMLPVLFNYSGAAVAGQFGMTWNILGALRGSCAAWVRTRTSLMGTLVAAGEPDELNRIYRRVSRIAVLVMLAVSVVFCAAVASLDFWIAAVDNGTGFGIARLNLSDRLLPILPTVLLAAGLCAALVIEVRWTYIHAHGISPFVGAALAFCLVSGLTLWATGRWAGAVGVSAAYLTLNALIYLPIFLRYAGRLDLTTKHATPPAG